VENIKNKIEFDLYSSSSPPEQLVRTTHCGDINRAKFDVLNWAGKNEIDVEFFDIYWVSVADFTLEWRIVDDTERTMFLLRWA